MARSNQHSDGKERVGNAFSDTDAVFSVGTGWPIETGYVVTNNHVVSDSDEIILVDRDGNEIRAWPVLRDELHDIALLAVRDTDKLPPALPLAGIQVHEGADVFTIGFPKPESAELICPAAPSALSVDSAGLTKTPIHIKQRFPFNPATAAAHS